MSRFAEQQIFAALRHAERGTPLVEVCRKRGIAELRRLREVEDENQRLKQLVAVLALDKPMPQEVLRKKLVKPAQKAAVEQFFCGHLTGE